MNFTEKLLFRPVFDGCYPFQRWKQTKANVISLNISSLTPTNERIKNLQLEIDTLQEHHIQTCPDQKIFIKKIHLLTSVLKKSSSPAILHKISRILQSWGFQSATTTYDNLRAILPPSCFFFVWPLSWEITARLSILVTRFRPTPAIDMTFGKTGERQAYKMYLAYGEITSIS